MNIIPSSTNDFDMTNITTIENDVPHGNFAGSFMRLFLLSDVVGGVDYNLTLDNITSIIWSYGPMLNGVPEPHETNSMGSIELYLGNGTIVSSTVGEPPSSPLPPSGAPPSTSDALKLVSHLLLLCAVPLVSSLMWVTRIIFIASLLFIFSNR